jgi:hypothetical protein
MIEAVSISETSVNIYQTTGSNTPEDSHLHTTSRQNFKFRDLEIREDGRITLTRVLGKWFVRIEVNG